MNDTSHTNGGSLTCILPGYVRRDTALHVLNTTYVVFIGLIFSSIFYFTGGSDVRILIVPMSLSIPALLFSSSIILYLILLWLCDNFYMTIPLHISDMLLTFNLLRIAMFGCCFVISLNDGPEKFLIFGIAAFLEGIVYYFLYANLLQPLSSDSGIKWLRDEAASTQSSVVILMAQEGVKIPKICAFVVAAFRSLLAIGIIVFSVPSLLESSENINLSAILFCVSSYMLIQLFLWAVVFRRGLLNKYIRLFSLYETYRIQQIKEG